jgi:RNA polymerase sigma-70 factor (sigma-E family)
VGDRFEDYVAHRGDVLLRFAYVLSGDRYQAEDLVQEVLARVYPRWHRLSYLVQPDAYLRTAIVRQFVSWRRRRASREASLAGLPEPAATGPDAASEHAARDEMWRLLATLPRRQRAVLVLRFYEDLPDGSIAEVLGCRPATVRVHAARALTRLRQVVPARPRPPAGRLTEPVGGDS